MPSGKVTFNVTIPHPLFDPLLAVVNVLPEPEVFVNKLAGLAVQLNVTPSGRYLKFEKVVFPQIFSVPLFACIVSMIHLKCSDILVYLPPWPHPACKSPAKLLLTIPIAIVVVSKGELKLVNGPPLSPLQASFVFGPVA